MTKTNFFIVGCYNSAMEVLTAKLSNNAGLAKKKTLTEERSANNNSVTLEFGSNKNLLLEVPEKKNNLISLI